MRKKLIIGEENIANLSGRFFAILFGVISPKISTITVRTTVETVAARSGSLSLSSPVKNRVAREALSMLTILFPISIVEMRVS